MSSKCIVISTFYGHRIFFSTAVPIIVACLSCAFKSQELYTEDATNKPSASARQKIDRPAKSLVPDADFEVKQPVCRYVFQPRVGRYKETTWGFERMQLQWKLGLRLFPFRRERGDIRYPHYFYPLRNLLLLLPLLCQSIHLPPEVSIGRVSPGTSARAGSAVEICRYGLGLRAMTGLRAQTQAR